MNVEKSILVIGIALSCALNSVAFSQQATIQALNPSTQNIPDGAVGVDANTGAFVDRNGYKIITDDNTSEFDHFSESFVKDWREATPVEEYEDTEFGESMYNEASTPTKLEILRLLSKDTPSLMVFMTAISMGVDIENALQASVAYQPNKGRDLAASAVNILPLITEAETSLYSGYELADLEREDETKAYSVAKVIEKFFDSRKVLRPYPDWFEGQFHFMASAKELSILQKPQKDIRWYHTKSHQNNQTTKRPIFVSLYEATNSVLIDGQDRIAKALAEDPNVRLPVVFIFNHYNERPLDQIGYPLTIKGIQDAYSEKQLILTPAPEWQLGEYHIYAGLKEFYEIFDIPSEADFEPEAWRELLAQAEDYTVTDTAFLSVILGGAEGHGFNAAKNEMSNEQLFAAWDDPTTESTHPWVTPKNGRPVTLKNITARGVIFNRPDLIAALDALGVQKVPVVFYYLDSSRVKPFTKGPRVLIQAAIGLTNPDSTFGGGGGITPPPPNPPVCASPPCTEQ